ncbi:MAG TPA: aldehyde dehydrogenase family protein [Thermoanaerobaculia bacterium]|jgi:acyl-CoA reductase-like NAD-dependent aldehyde dehydrogenase
MRPVLLLVDLQNDFLNAPGLEPAARVVIANARRLLDAARAAGVPVLHAITAVDASGRDAMPHWSTQPRLRCVRGTPGHAEPPELSPVDGEETVSKAFFSAFSATELDRALAAARADTLLVAGVHLHGCVRATVLDAYQRGLAVWIAEDAVASDDPLHAAVTRRYLEGRAARFASVTSLIARLKGHAPEDDADPRLVNEAVRRAREANVSWSALPPGARSGILAALAERLEADGERSELARRMAVEVGKPVSQGEAEVRRTAELLRHAAALGVAPPGPVPAGSGSAFRRVPLGVVAAITPWNNPLAIPWGKLGPALALGNTAVWKPAPAATAIAGRSLELAHAAGLPDGVVRLVAGDHRAAAAVMSDPGVDAVTLSGSSAAGWAAQEICARRRIPLQAELGGNNAAIVWTGADLDRAASQVARGAFAFAGQRCTANRRAIVADALFPEFRERVLAAVASLHWGDPLDPETEIGPLVSVEARDRVAAAVAEAAAGGAQTATPHRASPDPAGPRAWYPPTVVADAAPESAIVQEETFGPVLVLQRARTFDEALALANGVRQGLVAALFAGPGSWNERFAREAQSGVLKWNLSTADADASAPFGGWKASGLGPPEHGPGDLEFYSRLQALYGAP